MAFNGRGLMINGQMNTLILQRKITILDIYSSKRIARAILIAVVLIFTLSACGDDLPPNMVHNPDQLAGTHIGVLQGSPSLRLASEYGTVHVASTREELLSTLRLGAVDAVLMESTAANAFVSGASGIRILPNPLIEYELRFAVPVENPELLRVVNASLATLESNGVLQGFRDKYFGVRSFTYIAPDDISSRPGSLVLAVPPEAYPFSFRDRDGNMTGLHVDVARAIADLRGLELIVIEVDPGDLVTAVWHGRADISAGWLPDDIGYFITVSEPYAIISHSIVVRR